MIPSGATEQMARTPALFDHALAELGHGNGIWGPFSFKDYAARAAITASRSTPEYISVDHFHRLPSALKRADAMVLRLYAYKAVSTIFSCSMTSSSKELLLRPIYQRQAFASSIPLLSSRRSPRLT